MTETKLETTEPGPRGGRANTQLTRYVVIAAVAVLITLVVIGWWLLPRSHPGPIGIWGHTVTALRESRRLQAATDLESLCREESCECFMQMARLALDYDLVRVPLAIASASRSCGLREQQSLAGMQLEVGARSGKIKAVDEVRSFLAKNPENANALCAWSLLSYQQGSWTEAALFAARASAAGRGAASKLLEGLSAQQLGQPSMAEAAFRDVLRLDPQNADATYDLALVAHGRRDYRHAREGYLAALRIRPNYPEARYNLALLAHSVGADNEAKHHLQELKATKPKGDWVANLEKLLAQPVVEKTAR